MPALARMSLSIPVWPSGPVAAPNDADGSMLAAAPAPEVLATPAVAPAAVRDVVAAVRAAVLVPADEPVVREAAAVADWPVAAVPAALLVGPLPDVAPGVVLAPDELDEESVVPLAEPIVLSDGIAASSAAVGGTYPAIACNRCRPNWIRFLPIDA